MNYWGDTHAYQQSNKTSPPSATAALGLVMIAYVDHGLTATNRDPTRTPVSAGWLPVW